MAFPQPFQTLVKNVNPVVAKQIVGAPSQDLPLNLVDRSTYGGNYPILDSQMWRETDMNGNRYVHPAKNTSIIPYSNPFSPNSGGATGAGVMANANTVLWNVQTFRGILERVYLEINVTNGGGAPVTPAPLHTWFSDFRVFTDNNDGAAVILGMGGDNTGNLEYYSYGMERSDEQRLILEDIVNIDEPTMNGMPLAAGASRRYIIRVPGWWEVVPYPCDVTQTFNVRFTNIAIASGSGIGWLNPSTAVGTFNIQSYRLILETRVVGDVIYDALKMSYIGNPTANIPGGLTVKWMEHVTEQFTPTLAASTSYTFNLINVRGVTPQLDMVVLPATGAEATWADSIDAIETVLIQDSSGTALLGQTAIPTQFLQTHSVIENGLFSRMPTLGTKTYVPIIFGEGGWVNWKKNRMALIGYQSLKENIIRLTTKSGLVGATYRLRFFCYRSIYLQFTPTGTGKDTLEIIRFG